MRFLNMPWYLLESHNQDREKSHNPSPPRPRPEKKWGYVGFVSIIIPRVFILWILPFNHIQTFYAISFQAGFYCKIHLQMLKILASHHFLTMVAA